MRPGFRSVLFFFVFLLPVLGVAAYELRYATDRFHSDASISITEDNNATQTFDLTVIGLPAMSSDKDALTLVTFISSLDMLQYLEASLHLREHYSALAIDWYSRLPPEASLEQFHDYMSGYIVPSYDSSSHIVSVQVQAFSRDFAQKIVNTILARSQSFVDNLNTRVTREQTQFFEKQLAASEARLKEAKSALLKFQRENLLLTTDTEAAIINATIGELTRLLIAKEGELSIKQRELNDNSPVIQILKSEIETLTKQIAEEKQKLSGGSDGEAVSELAAQFREIQFNLEFVENIYKSNLAQLERARLEAIQRLKYLVVITEPSLADSSLYPNRPFIIITAILVMLMVYFVMSLIVAIIREHA
jgi:capsular polysaccharide transport system permease protein